jgi:hypothetical protein
MCCRLEQEIYRRNSPVVPEICNLELFVAHIFFIMGHVDPLLGNDHEISNYTMAVTRQRSINSNRETVFSVWSVPRYEQDALS